ncbi:MAG: SufD family Fe-S cluster assembly protein, partial [Steroidobacteraceae bacterium]|nr:SufD family Fe-S cluster assembly protein [Steroidobacteraceae bacterium]MDW8260319.1 SufD family Fe-S cluster assembly protein [Gammaproteobacteria bacterium]
RNLLVGDLAAANARPQLEILTDDVDATHGATTGTLDPAMLFYLLSRGLDRETARSVLQWAFLQDVIATLEPEPLRAEVERLLLARLHDPHLPAAVATQSVV